MAGFECEFIEQPPKAVQFECPICLLVLREPYQTTCCGNSFCRQCIDRAKARSQVCPTCNGRDFNLFHNLGLQRSLYDFQVYCKNKSQGCEWTGELRELDNHLNSDPPADKALQGCPFTLLKCPLGCPGCVEGLRRKNYKSHVIGNIDKLLGLVVGQAAQIKFAEQQNTQHTAQLANLEGEKHYLEQHVLELEARVGGLEREMKEVKGQLSGSEGEKQYLEQQVADLSTKMTKLSKKFVELETKNRELENEVKMRPPAVVSNPPSGQPSSNYPLTEFTMTNFEEYKRDNDEWHSPPFYTHPNGYKMCLRIDANGNGRYKGTHLSVLVCLMRGEFDDQLKWPFKGKITVKLTNQEEGVDHLVKTVSFTSSIPQEYCQRVMDEGPGRGWGYGQFIPLTELQPKYLKDDCIKLCIKRVEHL